jgi:hypothetical protein
MNLSNYLNAWYSLKQSSKTLHKCELPDESLRDTTWTTYLGSRWLAWCVHNASILFQEAMLLESLDFSCFRRKMYVQTVSKIVMFILCVCAYIPTHALLYKYLDVFLAFLWLLIANVTYLVLPAIVKWHNVDNWTCINQRMHYYINVSICFWLYYNCC